MPERKKTARAMRRARARISDEVQPSPATITLACSLHTYAPPTRIDFAPASSSNRPAGMSGEGFLKTLPHVRGGNFFLLTM